MVNNFEDTFGDIHGSGKGVWRQLSKTICYNLPRYVVSLASFSGNFTVMYYSHLGFHISIGLSIKAAVCMQEKRGFLHARAYLLNGMDAPPF